MAKALSAVSIKMNDGTTYYVPMTEFHVGGVSESVDSVIGQYIRGKRGPLLRANATADFTGAWVFVNPLLISSVTPTYS